MTTFITSTCGLTVNGHGKFAKLVRVEYYRNADDSVTLRDVSGHNLAPIGHSVTISAETFADRPVNVYNNTHEALWALAKLGWTTGDDDTFASNTP